MASLLVEIEDTVFEINLDGLSTAGESDSASSAPTDSQACAQVVTQLGVGSYHVIRGNRSFKIGVERVDASSYRVTLNGSEVVARVRTAKDRLLERYGVAASSSAGEAHVKAPMPGLVLRVLVGVGDVVTRGQGILVLEAMKMENELAAPIDGTIRAIHAAVGDAVGKNSPLVEIAAPLEGNDGQQENT
jgi:biotin carboxyl carrier protein